MTAATAPLPRAAGWASRIKLDGVLTTVVVVFPLALLMSWPKLSAVWQTGTFFDTDDAMRMVQVRDWLAGQSWFDLTAHRLDPPAGVFMHWSRVVDVPLAALIKLFELFTGPENAEKLTRLVFPLALQAAMVGATAWVARVLAGPRAALPAGMLLLLSGMAYGQFQPGRVDHHAPQILLLMVMTGTTVLSLDPKQARKAALTGVLAAISLAISLENLPFMAVILAVPPIAWAVRGAAYRPLLLHLAIGLGSGALVFFAATVGPARYGIVAFDAFSIVHLSAIALGVAVLAAFAALTPVLADARLRWVALATGAAVVLGMLAIYFPGCLERPYATLDPLLTRHWLDHVTEAQPLAVAVALRPDTLTVVIIPMLLGAIATAIAACRETGSRRARRLVLAALVVVGFVGTCWQIRVSTSTQPLAVLGGTWVVTQTIDFALRRAAVAWAALPLLPLVVFSSVAWAFVPAGNMPAQSEAELTGGMQSRDARALAPLNSLPPSLVFAPIDTGAHLLAHTGLSVLAAPYHRDQKGDRIVLEGFMAKPEAAKAIVEASGARYLVFCPGEAQVQIMSREAPQGLAAELVAGRIPAWLRPVPVPGTPYRVFAVE